MRAHTHNENNLVSISGVSYMDEFKTLSFIKNGQHDKRHSRCKGVQCIYYAKQDEILSFNQA